MWVLVKKFNPPKSSFPAKAFSILLQVSTGFFLSQALTSVGDPSFSQSWAILRLEDIFRILPSIIGDPGKEKI